MIESLGKIRSLEECTQQELQTLADICRPTTIQEGDRIFEAGDQAEFLYFVTKGVVELRFKVTHYLSTNEITLDRVREGEALGWSSLAESRPYTLSALTVRGGELLKLAATDVRKLCADNHHFGFVLMKNIAATISERFDLTQQMLMDFVQTRLDEKERRM